MHAGWPTQKFKLLCRGMNGGPPWSLVHGVGEQDDYLYVYLVQCSHHPEGASCPLPQAINAIRYVIRHLAFL